jgi:hypothetical protein
MKSASLVALGLLVAAPAFADGPVSIGLQARYGRETELGVGARADAAFSVARLPLHAAFAVDRSFTDVLSYSEISLSLLAPVVRRGPASFYLGAGGCGSRVGIETQGRAEPGTLTVTGAPAVVAPVSRSRHEWGMLAAAGLRGPGGFFVEGRLATAGVERRVVTFGVLF